MSGHNGRQIGRALFYAAAAGTLILDQASKTVVRSVMEIGRRVDVIPGFFYLSRSENPGAAFGILGAWSWLLIIIGLVAVVVILGFRRERSRSRVLALSLGLLLGGAVGNLVDRVLFGKVTDFLHLEATVAGRVLSWPTFNVADIAITAGVVMLGYHLILLEKHSTGDKR